MKVILLFMLLLGPIAYGQKQTLSLLEKIRFKKKHEKMKYFLLTGENNKAKAVLNSASGLFQKADLFQYFGF